MRCRIFNLIASCSALSVAGAAWAVPPTVNIKTEGLGSGWRVRVNNSQNVWAGQIKLSAHNSTDTARLANGNYTGFCVELLENTWVGANHLYNIVSAETVPNRPGPMGPAKASALQDLYIFANGAQFGSSSDFASAFQIAVWEVVNDGPSNLNVNTGSFTASNFNAGVSAHLSSLFGAVGSYPFRRSSVNLVGLSNGSASASGYQDFIVPGPNLTPEAPGYVLALALAAPIALCRSRKKRRDSAA